MFRSALSIAVILLLTSMAWGAEDSIRFGGTGNLPWDTNSINSSYIQGPTGVDTGFAHGRNFYDGSGADSGFGLLVGTSISGTVYRIGLINLPKMYDTFALLTGAIPDSAFLVMALRGELITASGHIHYTITRMEVPFIYEWTYGSTPIAGGVTFNFASYDGTPWNAEYGAGPLGAADTTGSFTANDIIINDGAAADTVVRMKIDTAIINAMKAISPLYVGSIGLYPYEGSGIARTVVWWSEHCKGTYASKRMYVVVYYHLPAASSGRRRAAVIQQGG